jgi:hypothetical protein
VRTCALAIPRAATELLSTGAVLSPAQALCHFLEASCTKLLNPAQRFILLLFAPYLLLVLARSLHFSARATLNLLVLALQIPRQCPRSFGHI